MPEIITEVKEVRDGLTQVTYKNGLTLSIGSSESHYSQKRFGVPLTVEVAVIHPEVGLLQISEYDTVAQLDIARYEHLTEKMQRLAEFGADEAAKELMYWADF